MFIKLIYNLILLSGFATVTLCADKEPCDLADEVCVTNAAKSLINIIVSQSQLRGKGGSDPLYVEKIIGNLPFMNFTLTDVYMHGLKDCDVHKLKFITDSTWYYYLICPRLTIKSDYEAKGIVASIPFEGKGKSDIIFVNYHIGTQGEVETKTGSDGKQYFNITNYKIDLLEAKDKVIYNFTNLLHNDKEKTEKLHKSINDNWKKVSVDTQHPLMDTLMDHLFENINRFISVVPKFELFYKNT